VRPRSCSPALPRLGGKVIPHSAPAVRFKLNHSSTKLQPGEPDTSVWVGDLTPEVDDYTLFCFFMERYGAVRYAKVVLDESGFSKGYGFVRLASEAEQRHALAGMTGAMGLGSKPIKVSMANQRSGRGPGGLARPGTWRPPPGHHRAASVSPDPQAGRSFTGPPPSADFSAYQQQYYQTLAAQQQQAMAMAWQMQQLQLQQQLSPAVSRLHHPGGGGQALLRGRNEELLLQ
jgi:RNA recognition motif-containing protein